MHSIVLIPSLVVLLAKGISGGAACGLAGALVIGSIVIIIFVSRAHHRRAVEGSVVEDEDDELEEGALDPLFGTNRKFFRPIGEELVAGLPDGTTGVELVLKPDGKTFRIHAVAKGGEGPVHLSEKLKRLVSEYGAYANRFEGGLMKMTFVAERNPDGTWKFTVNPSA